MYPAIFSYAPDGISIEFPDLPGCLPCGKTTEEALKNAKEAMALHLWGMENDNVPIPEPSPIDEIKLKPSQVIVLVEVYLPIYRDAIENQSVKKTLTIPQWLNKIAEENHVNFSQILQKALKEHLGINDRP
ncbi:MAG TPA: type II toxin-antitoxin system HicB family antitoxin [Bacillota bacterium]|nr:type II toxin-antitoxin system HicB family antitoxin [Peptococcaceae bacterium MAG4]NLW39221.1 type II toxin-antitoxin system HicB family antitoxin [Peptococcaceae bacterium]HPU35648.1 type II toxin-antitoxin system HicB family antitoxin [Bacillota bacterium]HPZ42825.1 type II toxin-antitoxin system HicB family antitoxin [Bacillota bacterium]HQD75580.1 type II toxin-antitoxin system HicB family antitoxin [Bacillota bacterium]